MERCGFRIPLRFIINISEKYRLRVLKSSVQWKPLYWISLNWISRLIESLFLRTNLLYPLSLELGRLIESHAPLIWIIMLASFTQLFVLVSQYCLKRVLKPMKYLLFSLVCYNYCTCMCLIDRQSEGKLGMRILRNSTLWIMNWNNRLLTNFSSRCRP